MLIHCMVLEIELFPKTYSIKFNEQDSEVLVDGSIKQLDLMNDTMYKHQTCTVKDPYISMIAVS